MDWIKKQARLYERLASTPRYNAVVHLEDKEDTAFWNLQLQTIYPGRYRFIPYSKSNKGTDTRGCEQCLRFRNYLSSRFFICIDSDLRLLRNEPDFDAEHYISQTYAYSWENHLCEADSLQTRFKKRLPECSFDFRIFLAELSKIVYQPLLYLVRYGNDSKLNKQWSVAKFNACIPLQPQRADLVENGKAYLSKVNENFCKKLATFTHAPAVVSSLTPENAYLHMQGHQLYKLVMHIGTLLCSGTAIAFKSDILDIDTPKDGYEEIASVSRDLKKILKEE